MASTTAVRPIVKLRSTTGTGAGTSSVTRKDRRNDPERLVLRKYNARVRGHVKFKAEH
ncbi:50S ribosomal protein L33 [Pseudonocardia sp. NPDC049635]|uniref:50S ribosomal protein L33 n=1 Tax=Pseudonocardia sp. NPDC049635 TaxID=3155506 RepID=UPI0033DB2FDD